MSSRVPGIIIADRRTVYTDFSLQRPIPRSRKLAIVFNTLTGLAQVIQRLEKTDSVRLNDRR